MRSAPAATDTTAGWGSSALRRATLTLAIAQLVSWGVLFYGFAVTAPEITDDTGWSDGLVAGAFALGLLIAGFGAPPIARALARYDPRLVLTTGSIVGMIGMLAFAAAPNPPVLYLAWIVIGAAMAATLYEPAMAVLVALDPPAATAPSPLSRSPVGSPALCSRRSPAGSSTPSAGAKRSPCSASAEEP